MTLLQISIAKPAPIVLDASRSAILVIDMQNDFAAKGGLFDRMGNDIGPVRALIDPISKMIALGRKLGMHIVFVKMGYKSDLSDIGPQGSAMAERRLSFGIGKSFFTPTGRTGRIQIRDTWCTDVLDELPPEPTDICVWKSRFSGFHKTTLDTELRALGIDQLVFTGCTTSVCVEATLRDAAYLDYQCLLLTDCTCEPEANGGNHDATIRLIQKRFGWTCTSDELLSCLES